MDKETCKLCNSEKIIKNMKIVDHGYMDTKHDLSIEFGEDIKTLIFKNKKNKTTCNYLWRLWKCYPINK